MSILVEAITVIFRNATADSLIAGGADEVRRNAPNKTFRSDGLLSAIGFMTPEDTERFVNSLKQVGFIFFEDGRCVDIAVCDQHRGFTESCDWLGTEQDHQGVRFSWLLGHEVGQMAVQDGWTMDDSLYSTGSFLADDAPDDHMEFLRTDNGLNVYLNKKTGKEVYVGRPFEDVDDIHTRKSKNLIFSAAVKMAVDALTADGWMFINADTDRNAKRHLNLRYRNQNGVVFLDVTWNGIPLSDFDGVAQQNFISLAKNMNSIPLLISVDIKGDATKTITTIKDVESCSSIEFHLRRNYVTHDLSKNKEWSELDYDLEAEIELSDWELHDFGIQVVRQTLEKEGHEILEWNPDVGALIQIVANVGGTDTKIVVNTVRYPLKKAEFDPLIIRRAAEYAANNQAELKLASVSLASADDPFDPDATEALPILRGTGVFPRFTGLEDPAFAPDG